MTLDIQQIKEIIPHRYPFLLVDKITNLVPGVTATGIKNVTANEAVFQGHFPNYSVFPGVLIVEALAQVGAIAIISLDEHKGKLGLFTGINKFKFRKQVLPGDVLTLEITIEKIRAGMGKGYGKAHTEQGLAAEGEILFALVKP